MPRIEIEVNDEAEGEAIKTALADPTTRAMVVVNGVLLPMSKQAQRRMLEYVADVAIDPDFAALTPPGKDGAPCPNQ